MKHRTNSKEKKVLFGVFANISQHDFERTLETHLRSKFFKSTSFEDPDGFKQLFGNNKNKMRAFDSSLEKNNSFPFFKVVEKPYHTKMVQ